MIFFDGETGTHRTAEEQWPLERVQIDPERAGLERYSKIDVEEIVLDAGATVLRLPMTYGPHDYQRREEWVLRRVRAGRRQLPVGVANAVLPLAFVGDVAQGVVSALEHRIGGVYNLVAASTDPLAVWVAPSLTKRAPTS